ncbi:hypothetical protein HZD82_25340, partial [Pantoea agglomerans]|uniref:hypothetical protein n=1 Tax=Enterobacter agglomerans TaxID=549 RepID=UPI001A8C4FC9
MIQIDEIASDPGQNWLVSCLKSHQAALKTEQRRSSPTVAVPSSVSPSVITTVEPGCMPPPPMVGVLSLVLLPS